MSASLLDRFAPDWETLSRGIATLGRPDQALGVSLTGRVEQVVGLVIEAVVPEARIGALYHVDIPGRVPLVAEVVGFRAKTALMMPLGEIEGVRQGCPVRPMKSRAVAPVGPAFLGRAIDGLGRPLDGGPMPEVAELAPLYANPPNPMLRAPVRQPLSLGVRAIDAMLTCGRGQRLGIMAGSGVGKSTLLGMMARQTEADVNVIALIGERGREVRNFVERDLGPEGMKRSVLVVATSDTAPLIRIRAAWLATTLAEYFRRQGQHVLLMMDSLTRFAMAQREVGLAVGEPPTTRGYTPSVFTLLPRLLERAGNDDGEGTLTGLYTVLVEGDDMNDPVGDASRAILDGHIVLSRALAARAHYPSIDILESASRCMNEVTTKAHQQAAGKVRRLMATWAKVEDLIRIGAYQQGSDPAADAAVAHIESINMLLQQGVEENATFERAEQQLTAIARRAGGGA
ncbi:MAG: FliI/YscN family ATPase [Bradymonadia bacterium]